MQTCSHAWQGRSVLEMFRGAEGGGYLLSSIAREALG